MDKSVFWQEQISELLVNDVSMLTAACEWLEPTLRPHPLCYLSEVPSAGIWNLHICLYRLGIHTVLGKLPKMSEPQFLHL